MDQPKELFIIKFIEGALDIIHNVSSEISRVPYKGFRYSLFGSDHYKNSRTYKGFRNLEGRNIIRRLGDDKFVFTNKGRQWLKRSATRYFRNRHKIWDHKWRVIIFDIPTELHKERNRFRVKLKSLGFFMLQKSVFVLPYPCEEELGDICSRLRVSEYVDIITAESVGFRTKELLEVFSLA